MLQLQRQRQLAQEYAQHEERLEAHRAQQEECLEAQREQQAADAAALEARQAAAESEQAQVCSTSRLECRCQRCVLQALAWLL